MHLSALLLARLLSLARKVMGKRPQLRYSINMIGMVVLPQTYAAAPYAAAMLHVAAACHWREMCFFHRHEIRLFHGQDHYMGEFLSSQLHGTGPKVCTMLSRVMIDPAKLDQGYGVITSVAPAGFPRKFRVVGMRFSGASEI